VRKNVCFTVMYCGELGGPLERCFEGARNRRRMATGELVMGYVWRRLALEFGLSMLGESEELRVTCKLQELIR
jgi:hypothetical protein